MHAAHQAQLNANLRAHFGSHLVEFSTVSVSQTISILIMGICFWCQLIFVATFAVVLVSACRSSLLVGIVFTTLLFRLRY